MVSSRHALNRLTLLFSAVAVALGLVGCAPIRSEQKVTGIYELNVENQKIILTLDPNHSFEETIQLASGQVNKHSGLWRWSYGRIGFEGLWIPPSFAPDYIRQADAQAGPGQPKYTERGGWSITAESHWGNTVLPIFPDADIYFQMVKHLNR
jgi:hypothetical protein